ncbi:ABC transporter substrate-binding protein [Agarivorans gilvus]|uniref:ABC transporter substrate-binding protein n=1 Tax=Agarivorans gilvus TaxID=680279 RepID=UPI001E57F3DA|nr:ABC transporter substrate-binding protein [Agarivorans gilvus]
MVFFNPGKSDESFWHDVDSFAGAVAEDLALDFRTFHAQRKYYSMIRHLEQMIAQQQLPDYLILVNEKQILPKMLRLLEGQNVYVLVALNDIDVQHQSMLEQPYWQQHLLSSLIPNNYWAGYQAARAMHLASGELAGEVAIISGDKLTPASIQREAGAKHFFQQQPQLELKRVVYADWNEQQGYQQTLMLLRRYPNLKYLWVANDEMAFGSIQASKELGRQAGKDLFIATFNTSERALNLREQGQISALAGGHFATVGWGLAMIKQHSLGEVLAKKVDAPLFMLLEPHSATFQLIKDKNWQQLDFSNLSFDFAHPFGFIQ